MTTQLTSIRAALEVALNNMPPIISGVNIVGTSLVSTGAVFTTDQPHGLTSQTQILISGYTGSAPAVNGGYLMNVLSPNTFTLLDILNKSPVILTAAGSNGSLVAQLTAWENVAFATNNPLPFQKIILMPATPENPTMGDGFYREVGMIQITLVWPGGLGTKAVTDRAGLIKSTFARGSTFEADGITVRVLRTPAILTGSVVDNSFLLPVRIQYQADIFNS